MIYFNLYDYLDEKMKRYFYNKIPTVDHDVIEIQIIELLKYLILAAYTKVDIPFNQEIDEVWHLWIMQTRQYQELMDKLPTKKFIHHSSNDYFDHA